MYPNLYMELKYIFNRSPRKFSLYMYIYIYIGRLQEVTYLDRKYMWCGLHFVTTCAKPNKMLCLMVYQRSYFKLLLKWLADQQGYFWHVYANGYLFCFNSLCSYVMAKLYLESKRAFFMEYSF